MFGNDDMSVSTFYCNPQNSPIKRPSMARNQGNRNGRIRREAIVASGEELVPSFSPFELPRQKNSGHDILTHPHDTHRY